MLHRVYMLVANFVCLLVIKACLGAAETHLICLFTMFGFYEKKGGAIGFGFRVGKIQNNKSETRNQRKVQWSTLPYLNNKL